jgi:hypothetical protein
MLDLHKKLAAAAIPDEKARFRREIESTDRRIDGLVYDQTWVEIQIVGT